MMNPLGDSAARFEEFPAGMLRTPTRVERRRFLQLLGASLALAGAGGCRRTTPRSIVPSARRDGRHVPGVAQWYATSVLRDGYAMGVLVRSNDGRPTKIEGNPDHPASLGATDAVTQAELLTLYDPRRSRTVRRGGGISDWDALESALRARVAALVSAGGEGLHVVLPPTTSPTLLAVVERVRGRLPHATWYRHDPLAGPERGPGPDLIPDFAAASVVVALDGEVFAPSPGGVRRAHDFAAARRAGGLALFVAEPVPTASGARADERLPVRRGDIPGVAAALARAVGIDVPAAPGPDEPSRAWVDRAAAALRGAGDGALVLAGPAQGAATHELALDITRHLGGLGRTLRAIAPVERFGAGARPLSECADALNTGAVDTLLLLGVNPAFDAPCRGALRESLGRAGVTLHLGLYRDETAELCAWHAPLAHDLERWGDARAFDGTAGVLQPLTEPIYGGRSMEWLLSVLAGDAPLTDRERVRECWRGRAGGDDFEVWWTQVLRSGVVPGSASEPAPAPRARRFAGPVAEPGAGLELAANPHACILDGRGATNAWLQELPDPITQLTWTNAALVSPDLGRELGVRDGDVVRLTAGAESVELPALVVPGVAPRTVGVTLGHGRTLDHPVARGRGADVTPLRAGPDAWLSMGVRVERVGGAVTLPLAQLHASMEGRDIVRVRRPGETAPDDVHLPQFRAAAPGAGPQWGMSIDLAACTGCGACVVACQAENNVPSVGPEEVARGRRMHWLRVDRYFAGPADRPEVLFQPLACVHCEEAPCELVCPTGATQHSADGLNEMNYARCVGTRYCSNNCPYKVRRFNFFRYADDGVQAQRMRNPRVVARGRGVMEKCTYCVHRIRAAEMDARVAGTPLAGGAVVPACQQACPTRAIVFGDVSDPGSAVSTAKRDPRSYALLGHLGTSPRTTYLADVRPAAGAGS